MSTEKVSNGWFVIMYRIPSSPSTSRITVWKRLKELGALHLQQSVYVLPHLPQLEKPLQELNEQTQELGGQYRLLEISSFGEEQEKEVINQFNVAREQEYTEVIEACSELSLEIDKESKAEEFHYPDLEENEKHLQKVRELLESVKNRDYFSSPLQDRAVTLLRECEEKYEQFSHEVFVRAGIVTEDKQTALGTGTRYNQRQTYAKKELIARLREIINRLSRNSLEVKGKKVSDLSDSIILESDYREYRTKNSLDIKIEWPSRLHDGRQRLPK